MSLYCSTSDAAAWWYEVADDFSVLNAPRAKRCCSCNKQLLPGEEVLRILRRRGPRDDIEERIYGDECPLATWLMCERCGGLLLAVHEAGFCCDPTEDMATQIKEYRQDEL